LAVRSTLVTNESNQTIPEASAEEGDGPATGSNVRLPGRKSRPRLSPALPRTSSRISESGSLRPSASSTVTNTISGTGSPAARASSPATSSATSAFTP